MGVTNGIITTPISITDVRTAIGDASYDLGTLCKSSKINKWAKYKPVRLNAVDVSSQLDSSKNWKSTSTWWKASDGSCGLSIPTYSSFYTLKQAMINGVTWEYNKPTGGSSQPYRISDFIGYLHSAICPFGTGISLPLYIDNNGDVTFQLEGTVAIGGSGDNGNNLQLSHLSVSGINFANMYVGALLIKGNGYYAGTSSSTLGNGGVSVTFSDMSNAEGTYSAGLFLCSASFSHDGNQPAATFVPFPIAMQSVTLMKSSSIAQVIANGAYYFESNNTYITFSYEAINNSSASRNFNNITVLLYKGHPSVQGSQNEQTLITGENKTVSANDSYISTEITVKVNNGINESYEYYLVASADNITSVATPLEQRAPDEI